jgi:hypothetical protein
MKIGDHIKVKDKIKDPDFNDQELSGYTGYIDSIIGNYVEIIWDKKTLNRMDEEFIELCDTKNLDHTKMGLDISDIYLIND